ncbi:MAG: hypothetical protein ABID38_02220 [Candidatus Diapherotrites archaeon]
MHRISVMTEKVFLSSKIEEEILEIVRENWPTSALEIAEHLGEGVSTRELQRKASTKYSYYLKKLIRKKILVSKKAGNTMIVWPLEVEKYRTIHSILKGD